MLPCSADMCRLCCRCVQAFPVHLPTFVVRMLAFKLSMDTTRLPAVGDLLRGFAK
jgi:hypothetical protein